MRREPPGWWYAEGFRLAPVLLWPVGLLYGAAWHLRRWSTRPYRPRVPVVCIGNFTAGGAGKTPTALLIASELGLLGRKPAFLSRGYGGRLEGPHWVEAARDRAGEVGDEPLLLARAAPTLVARDRVAGAQAIEASDADVIVMDDGMQNPTLDKDLTLAVVDAELGVGNGLLIPAGPLRAPLGAQLRLAHGVLELGRPAPERRTSSVLPAGFRGLRLAGEIGPDEATDWLAGRPVVAYAGIGRPEKLFGLLRSLGAELRGVVPFPDHHAFTAEEAERLLAFAARHQALLVTTSKDWVRIGSGTESLRRLKALSRPLRVAVTLTGDGREQLRRALAEVCGGSASSR